MPNRANDMSLRLPDTITTGVHNGRPHLLFIVVPHEKGTIQASVVCIVTEALQLSW